VFGVDSGTPILNPGETAILGVGTISRRPWVVGEGGDERIEPRWVTTLALSFDHRVMVGQEGSELLADTAAFLREPALAVMA
jgi:pyruvate dehydrogenase E2 component (dihydrolipoamide acetyltransferase)